MTRKNKKNIRTTMMKTAAVAMLTAVAVTTAAFADCGTAMAAPAKTTNSQKTGTTTSTKDTKDTKDTQTTKPAKPDTTANGIAKLADLVGNWTLLYFYDDSWIDVNSETNPYDLEWRYGEKPDQKLTLRKTRQFLNDENWGALWESYVDYCDWSLVFDIDYYMETFPLLAALYEYDEDALLRHYQTQGIHEGRQANKDFNPAAYMTNCSKTLKNKFGDNPECYVIYYMTHYKAESKVDTSNKKNKYPVWLSVELSRYQQDELKAINEYRKEVKADPVDPHPELIAYANLRCRINLVEGYYAHDWLDSKEHDELQYANVLDVDYIGENTHWQSGTGMADQPYWGYRNSPPHYEAMVSIKQKYVGMSNSYASYETKESIEFDLYAPSCPKPGSNELPK